MNKQKDISAERDVIGGDQNNLTFNYNEARRDNTYTLLNKLYEQYQQDVRAKKQTDNIIRDLRKYYVASVEDQLRDLEGKLVDSGYDELLKQAKRYKSQFRQRIEEFRLFPSAQAIYAYLLGVVLTKFETYVLPSVQNKRPTAEIHELMQIKVVEAIIQTIPEVEPTCDYTDIYGMIYFLTGNCFIEWQE